MLQKLHLFSILFIAQFFGQCLAYYRILEPGETLEEGKSVQWKGCKLILRKNGKLVVERHGLQTWSTELPDIASKGEAYFAKMQTNGNLVVKTTNATQPAIFKTYSEVKNIHSLYGGLYFDDKCELKIAQHEPYIFIWSNIRTKLFAGNTLRKGEMYKFPENGSPQYTLYLQHNGNLIVFRGFDLTRFEKSDIFFSADVTSESDEFLLKVTCDGRLVLKEKVSDEPRTFETYWSERVLAKEIFQGRLKGYSVVLNNDGIGHPIPILKCRDEGFSD